MQQAGGASRCAAPRGAAAAGCALEHCCTCVGMPLTFTSLRPPTYNECRCSLAWGKKQPATMGRMHSNGKGQSRSATPYKRSPPSWLKVTATEVRRRRRLRWQCQ